MLGITLTAHVHSDTHLVMEQGLELCLLQATQDLVGPEWWEMDGEGEGEKEKEKEGRKKFSFCTSRITELLEGPD